TGRDLVGAEVVVQQEEYLDLAGAEDSRDRIRDSGVGIATVAHTLEQPPGDRARESGLSARRASQELDDPLRGLRLEQVAGSAGTDRRKQVLLGDRCGQHHDLAAGRRLA